MLKTALLIAGKDLRLCLTRGRFCPGGPILLQALILGLLIIFMFSLVPAMALSKNAAGEPLAPALAAMLFWMSSLAAQTVIFQHLYAFERSGGVRLLLRAAPVAPQAVWLGKALAGLAFLVIIQLILFPALVLLLQQKVGLDWQAALSGFILADVGLAALGALLGAFPAAAPGASHRRSLLPAIFSLPLLIPLLLAAAQLFQGAFIPDVAVFTPDALPWLGLLTAFDALTIGAALVLFPHVFTEE